MLNTLTALSVLAAASPPAPPPEPREPGDPLPPEAEALVQMAKDGLQHRFESTPDSFVTPHAYAITASGERHIFDMPDCDIQRVRSIMKERLPMIGALAVVVVTETWSASSPDPAEQAMLAALADAGQLRTAPPHLLRSVIHVWVETPEMQVRGEETVIAEAKDGTRSLTGEWKQTLLSYPRPTFRRFFPEAR